MDWGLFAVMPSSDPLELLTCCPERCQLPSHVSHVRHTDKVFLRRLMMYPQAEVYYVCIIADLFLRFLWMISLVPYAADLPFVNPPALGVFFGSMEIFRRYDMIIILIP